MKTTKSFFLTAGLLAAIAVVAARAQQTSPGESPAAAGFANLKLVLREALAQASTNTAAAAALVNLRTELVQVLAQNAPPKNDPPPPAAVSPVLAPVSDPP